MHHASECVRNRLFSNRLGELRGPSKDFLCSAQEGFPASGASSVHQEMLAFRKKKPRPFLGTNIVCFLRSPRNGHYPCGLFFTYNCKQYLEAFWHLKVQLEACSRSFHAAASSSFRNDIPRYTVRSFPRTWSEPFNASCIYRIFVLFRIKILHITFGTFKRIINRRGPFTPAPRHFPWWSESHRLGDLIKGNQSEFDY